LINIKNNINKRYIINSLAEEIAVNLLKTLKRECKYSIKNPVFTLSDGTAVKNIKELLSAVSALCDKPMRVCASEESGQTGFSDAYADEISGLYDNINLNTINYEDYENGK